MFLVAPCRDGHGGGKRVGFLYPVLFAIGLHAADCVPAVETREFKGGRQDVFFPIVHPNGRDAFSWNSGNLMAYDAQKEEWTALPAFSSLIVSKPTGAFVFSQNSRELATRLGTLDQFRTLRSVLNPGIYLAPSTLVELKKDATSAELLLADSSSFWKVLVKLGPGGEVISFSEGPRVDCLSVRDPNFTPPTPKKSSDIKAKLANIQRELRALAPQVVRSQTLEAYSQDDVVVEKHSSDSHSIQSKFMRKLGEKAELEKRLLGSALSVDWITVSSDGKYAVLHAHEKTLLANIEKSSCEPLPGVLPREEDLAVFAAKEGQLPQILYRRSARDHFLYDPNSKSSKPLNVPPSEFAPILSTDGRIQMHAGDSKILLVDPDQVGLPESAQKNCAQTQETSIQKGGR